MPPGQDNAPAPTFYDTADVNLLHLNLQETNFKTQELLSFLPTPTEPVNLLTEAFRQEIMGFIAGHRE